ncbi:hypothetical protein AB0O91_36325 [Kitasatospora sp. NPDC089797]|uniref:hypothetical protein n=1 Tax=Kitasatospora sp. NPDC089797 TaxID=3155298 RepID=UPI00341B626C
MIILWGFAGLVIGSGLAMFVSVAARQGKPARVRAVSAVGALVLASCYARGLRLAAPHPGVSDYLVFSTATLVGLVVVIIRRFWTRHRSR